MVALCDTNGGMIPTWVTEIVAELREATGTGGADALLGIHAHNDSGCAVANSLAAIEAGCRHVQGTVNGYGERTGNADLLAIVANLELKHDMSLLPDGGLEEITRIAHAVAEITNIAPFARQPYVGASAFAHKAGLHASAIKVDPDLYQHIDPVRVATTCACWSPTWLVAPDRAQGPSSGRPRGSGRGPHPRHGQGQGARGRGLHLRRRGRLLRAALRAGSAPRELLRRRELACDRRDPAGRGARADAEATVVTAGGRRVVATGGERPVNASTTRCVSARALLPVRRLNDRLQGAHHGHPARHRRGDARSSRRWTPRAGDVADRQRRRTSSRPRRRLPMPWFSAAESGHRAPVAPH